jgi:hypothetical protein
MNQMRLHKFKPSKIKIQRNHNYNQSSNKINLSNLSDLSPNQIYHTISNTNPFISSYHHNQNNQNNHNNHNDQNKDD